MFDRHIWQLNRVRVARHCTYTARVCFQALRVFLQSSFDGYKLCEYGLAFSDHQRRAFIVARPTINRPKQLRCAASSCSAMCLYCSDFSSCHGARLLATWAVELDLLINRIALRTSTLGSSRHLPSLITPTNASSFLEASLNGRIFLTSALKWLFSTETCLQH